MKISKETSIGVVVILSLAIFIWGINFLKGMDVFSKERTFFARYQRVDGLKNSSPVTFKGFKIGQISKISFTKDGTNELIVAFSIQNNFELPSNSTARIISSDIMGTKEIKIMAGDSYTPLQPGDTLQGTIEGDLKEQVSMQMLPLKTKAERLLSSVDSVLTVIQYIFDENTRDDLSKSFASIRNTIQHLESTSGTLDTLMTNQKGKLASIFTNIDSITYNLKNNNQHISNILGNVSSISDSMSKARIGYTINQANGALTQANQILTKINSGQGSIGALINNDTLYMNLEQASQNLNTLMRDLHQNPKRYVRFSLFDTGRTIYQQSDKTKRQKLKENRIHYRIQIFASQNPTPLEDPKFKNKKNIQELYQKGEYKYTIGHTPNYKEIIRMYKKVKKTFPNAFIIKLSPEK